MSQTDNRRIVKNTVFLYFRMGISMLISLYTSRVILQILGVVDLGIYNVVGGITTIFTWLSGSLSNSTQRYLNFEIGQNKEGRLNDIFNQNFWIYAIFAGLSLIILETGGLWLIHNKLVIPADRIEGAIWTLHATSFTLAVTLIGTVYDSVLIARENMKIYAYIGMLDVVLKLVIVYLLLLFPYDRLKVYAVLLSCVFVVSKLVTIVYCRINYSECKLRFYWNQPLVKEMLAFVGWNSVGTVVFILNNQGIDILLNMFFGPVVNAAKAISNQVRNVVLNFTSNFLTAVRPQIVKKYAENDLKDFLDLIFNTSKYLFFIAWILGFSIILRINSILYLWLKNVPDNTASFCIWVIIFIMINVVSDPLNTAYQAIGKQSKFIIYGSGIYALAFPLSYLAYKINLPPVSAFIILAIVRFIYLMVVSALLRDYVDFKYVRYLKEVFLPIFKVSGISIIILLPMNFLLPDNIFGTISAIAISVTCCIILVYLFGLRQSERNAIAKIIKQKIHF